MIGLLLDATGRILVHLAYTALCLGVLVVGHALIPDHRCRMTDETWRQVERLSTWMRGRS